MSVTTAVTATRLPAAGQPRRVTRPAYVLREELPTPAQLARLRAANDMAPRSEEGLRRGLPNSVYGVVVVAVDPGPVDDPAVDGDDGDRRDGHVVGTARIVGDGGAIYYVCDMVVHPDHQRRGIGTRMMDALMDFIDETAPPDAYVNLMADVSGFYERWGFSPTAPVSKGMYLRVE